MLEGALKHVRPAADIFIEERAAKIRRLRPRRSRLEPSPGGRGNRKKAGKAVRGSQEARREWQRVWKLPRGRGPSSRVR